MRNCSLNARSRSFSKHSVNVFSPQVRRPVGPEIQQICYRYVKWKFKIISLSSWGCDKWRLIIACHKSTLDTHILTKKETNSCVSSESSRPTGLWILYICLLWTLSLNLYFDAMLDLSYTFWQICIYQNDVCESSVLGTKSIIHTPLLSVSWDKWPIVTSVLSTVKGNKFVSVIQPWKRFNVVFSVFRLVIKLVYTVLYIHESTSSCNLKWEPMCSLMR